MEEGGRDLEKLRDELGVGVGGSLVGEGLGEKEGGGALKGMGYC